MNSRCPECGALLAPPRPSPSPDTTVDLRDHPNPDLAHIYCRADCAIEAATRGYPLKLWNLRP